MKAAHNWTIEMLGCGHIYVVKTVPRTDHYEQRTECKECDGKLRYWRFR